MSTVLDGREVGSVTTDRQRRPDRPHRSPSSRTPPSADLVVVANRLPVRRVESPGAPSVWETSPGGLVSALIPTLGGRRVCWVGWTGDSTPRREPDAGAPSTSGDSSHEPPFQHQGMTLVPVPLDANEVADFYTGFSNATLWPLYHDAIQPPEIHRDWWLAYVAVNQRFAEAAAGFARPGAVVWVHDYQLQLVPAMLRKLRPDLRIGFFLHIPYPPQELFMRLPWRSELIAGMLGADVVGFQVPVAAQNFAGLARRLTSARGLGNTLKFEGRSVRVGAFPVSIDVEHFEELAARPEIVAEAQSIRAQLGSPRVVLLGVDRLDYTKGIEARLKAFREMLQDGVVSAGECALVQIAVPSRTEVPAYGDERDRVERLVGEINGDYGAMGAPAVHYFHRSLSAEELVALYIAADVMVVTPYRDGMNLVAKEYVACRLDDTGTLVLSEFAGAARELSAASLVNPYDTAGVKDALVAAIKASDRDVRRRMKALRRAVRRSSVHDWSKSFLDAMDGGAVRPV
jgi:trehalose 6-phosphate synthase